MYQSGNGKFNEGSFETICLTHIFVYLHSQMIDVLRNVYSNEIEQLHVIDCRYPYEYEGGHIESAKNIYTRSKIFEEYFRQPLESKDATKRNIFIFHCEFSSERAPSL